MQPRTKRRNSRRFLARPPPIPHHPQKATRIPYIRTRLQPQQQYPPPSQRLPRPLTQRSHPPPQRCFLRRNHQPRLLNANAKNSRYRKLPRQKSKPRKTRHRLPTPLDRPQNLLGRNARDEPRIAPQTLNGGNAETEHGDAVLGGPQQDLLIVIVVVVIRRRQSTQQQQQQQTPEHGIPPDRRPTAPSVFGRKEAPPRALRGDGLAELEDSDAGGDDDVGESGGDGVFVQG